MQYVVHRPRVGVFIDTQNLYHSARDLLERHIEEMRQARTERLRAIEIATRPTPNTPPVDYSPGAGSHRLALATAEMEEWAARNPPTSVLRKRHLEATRYLTKKRGTPA